MDSSAEKPEIASSACPHCGRPVRSADSPMRRRLADSDHYRAVVAAVAQSGACAPIEDLRIYGLV
jgi:hypothetical protein